MINYSLFGPIDEPVPLFLGFWVYGLVELAELVKTLSLVMLIAFLLSAHTQDDSSQLLSFLNFLKESFLSI